MKKILLATVLLSTLSFAGIKYYENSTINGQYFDKRYVETVQTCAYLCDIQRKCKAFNYKEGSTICTLLDKVESLNKANGIVAGHKVRDVKPVKLATIPKKAVKPIEKKEIFIPIKEKTKKIIPITPKPTPQPKKGRVVPTPTIAKDNTPSFFTSLSNGISEIGTSISNGVKSIKLPSFKNDKVTKTKPQTKKVVLDKVEEPITFEEETIISIIEEDDIIMDGDNLVVENTQIIEKISPIAAISEVQSMSEQEKSDVINAFVYGENNNTRSRLVKKEGYCILKDRKSKDRIVGNNCSLRSYKVKDFTRYVFSFNGGVSLVFEKSDLGKFEYISFEDSIRYPAYVNLKDGKATFHKYRLSYRIY